MSNTRKVRELNGGRLTRPRSQWRGKPRGGGSQRAADMNMSTNVFAAMLGLGGLKYRLPQRRSTGS